MPNYKVVAPIQHDEEVYVPGETITESKLGGKRNLRALMDAGAVVQDTRTSEVTEPPENYVAPDLRLSTGSAQGAAALAVGVPTPTNVQKPIPATTPPTAQQIPGVGAPQHRVFEKMAELAEQEQEEKFTAAKAQEARDKEQQKAADAAKSATQGGQTDPKKAAEAAEEAKKAQAKPTGAQPGPETPPPAQSKAAGGGQQ